MLYLAGIIITFFLVFILCSKQGKSEADKTLAVWLFFTGIHLLLFYLNFTSENRQLPYLLGVEIPFPLLHGPFLYLYATALTNQHKGRRGLLHFFPITLVYLLLIPFFILPITQKISVYNNDGIGYEQLMSFFYTLILASGIVYPILSYLKLLHHKRNIIDQFTYTETINLLWLRYLIAGTGIIWLVVIFGDDEQIFSTVVAYVFFIGYFGIKQVGIFTNKRPFVELSAANNIIYADTIEVNPPVSSVTFEDTIAKKVKYEKSWLTEAESEAIHGRLTQLMQQDKVYKSPELTLAELSQRLGVHPNILSQVINSIEQKNLYDYVNQYRVAEFKRLVMSPENQKFTLLSLAYECGYNSKTAFNRNFKKATGVSPTTYLKQANISLS